jgi:hypothetical protein
MKRDALTKIKYIGALRMKSLNDMGITTIKQLYETPLDKLAQLSTIGKYYARLIKAEVSKAYKEKPGEIASKITSDKEEEITAIKKDLNKKITVLKKRLKLASKDLKSLNKKSPKFYLDYKKRSKTLVKRLSDLTKTKKEFSDKILKNIIKKADSLNAILKNAGKDIKKKKHKKISEEIQSFSKMLKKSGV